jgi:hypothetical protein
MTTAGDQEESLARRRISVVRTIQDAVLDVVIDLRAAMNCLKYSPLYRLSGHPFAVSGPHSKTL